jgi:hypothetical protein
MKIRLFLATSATLFLLSGCGSSATPEELKAAAEIPCKSAEAYFDAPFLGVTGESRQNLAIVTAKSFSEVEGVDPMFERFVAFFKSVNSEGYVSMRPTSDSADVMNQNNIDTEIRWLCEYRTPEYRAQNPD